MSRGGRRPGVPAAVLVRRRERAARWTFAHLLLNHAAGRRLSPDTGVVSLSQLGELIAARLPWRDGEAAAEAIDKSQLSRIERGLVDPTPEIVVAYCEVLRHYGVKDVTPGWITYGATAGNKPPRSPLAGLANHDAADHLDELRDAVTRRPDDM